MSKHFYRLVHAEARRRAADFCMTAPDGFVVTVSEPTRNLEQNAKLWAMLSDVAEQVDWYGTKLSSEDWKTMFTAALRKERVVPGINGGFVVLGQSTSKMSKSEFSDLIELINAFAADSGVIWSDDNREAM